MFFYYGLDRILEEFFDDVFEVGEDVWKVCFEMVDDFDFGEGDVRVVGVVGDGGDGVVVVGDDVFGYVF